MTIGAPSLLGAAGGLVATVLLLVLFTASVSTRRPLPLPDRRSVRWSRRRSEPLLVGGGIGRRVFGPVLLTVVAAVPAAAAIGLAYLTPGPMTRPVSGACLSLMEEIMHLARLTTVIAFVAASFIGGAAQAADKYALDPMHTFVVFKITDMGYAHVVGWFTAVAGKLTFDPADITRELAQRDDQDG